MNALALEAAVAALDPMRIGGVIPPVITPLDAQERVDEPALRRLIQHLLAGGAHGLFLLGSSGEFAALRDSERRRVVEIAVSEAGGAVPILVGCGEASTRRALDAAHMAARAGAQGLVALLPYYFPVRSPREMVAHFSAIAREVVLPVLAYNIPSTTQSSLTLPVMQELSRMEGIIGLKDSSGDFAGFQALLYSIHDSGRFRLLQGDEGTAAASVLMGADGLVPAIANLVPKLCVGLWECARSGDAAEARRCQAELDRVRQLVYGKEDVTFVAAIKAGLSALGIIGEPVCAAPHACGSAKARAEIARDLGSLGRWL